MDSALIMERMYYIVDGRGNYYRVNAEDQLIVSQNRDNADLFALKEANKRINCGRKMNFYSILPAEDGVSELDGEVGVAEEKDDIKNENSFAEETKNEMQVEFSYEYDLDRLDWKEYLLHFSYVVSGLKKYQDKLNDDLSETDMCICDLMHYLELYDLNEEDYIKAASLIKKYREKRRVIKDKFHMTEWFQKAVGTNANLTKAKDAIAQIEKLDHRIYKPRMLADIFTDTLIPTNRNKQIEESLEDCLEAKEEKEMVRENLVRRKTKFDAGENDWIAMAAEQAQFFEEAKQYVCNLQISLNMVDEEIEQILLKTEETNCNAAEGYKTFKQLKNLRNERKRLKIELESVQIITNCFACEEMRDAYRYCEERIRNL